MWKIICYKNIKLEKNVILTKRHIDEKIFAYLYMTL